MKFTRTISKYLIPRTSNLNNKPLKIARKNSWKCSRTKLKNDKIAPTLIPPFSLFLDGLSIICKIRFHGRPVHVTSSLSPPASFSFAKGTRLLLTRGHGSCEIIFDSNLANGTALAVYLFTLRFSLSYFFLSRAFSASRSRINFYRGGLGGETRIPLSYGRSCFGGAVECLMKYICGRTEGFLREWTPLDAGMMIDRASLCVRACERGYICAIIRNEIARPCWGGIWLSSRYRALR